MTNIMASIDSASPHGAGRSAPNGQVVIGDVEYDGRVVLYIIKADETSYINYIKPLILAVELGLPHVISVIDTTSQWAYTIHPERMVPALKDQDAQTGETINVFEGTACLQYLADRFDVEGLWSGRTAKERAAVFTWTAYQTAGIGPTAKYWLYFLRGYPTRKDPVQLPRTIAKLHENVIRQWDILNKRLAAPEQQYIALPDRPTLADLSYFPFAMPWMFAFLGVNIAEYPHIEQWAERMLARPAVQDIMARAKTFGHDMTAEEARALKEAV
ncbi:putative glutathione S-transferase GliG-like protein [Aspergillus floccosus]